jgi:surfactin synthase thioesterase subunit
MAESGELWLRDFLPRQLKESEVYVRVMTYGYNSDTAFSKAVTDIDDEAGMLLDRIDGERQSHIEKQRPILFIAHSLGGIIVKKVNLILSSSYG